MAKSNTVHVHCTVYYSKEYHNSRLNIIILCMEISVDFRSEAWLNLLWEYINGDCLQYESQSEP